jgi:hypothetical protein
MIFRVYVKKTNKQQAVKRDEDLWKLTVDGGSVSEPV